MFCTAAVLVLSLGASLAWAGDKDPLFVNLTTDDVHRARMALTFAQSQQERGHPATVFLNDRGVFVGSRKHAAKYAEHQKMLATLMKQGGTVIICPMCMKHYAVAEADKIKGAKTGDPDLTGPALFKDNTKTLTW